MQELVSLSKSFRGSQQSSGRTKTVCGDGLLGEAVRSIFASLETKMKIWKVLGNMQYVKRN